MSDEIVMYTPDRLSDVREFIVRAIDEGNESLDMRKFDPRTLNGQIWLAYDGAQLVSLTAAEVSHYTGETDVVRNCRYHILKSHRHNRYGFKFLKQMVPWCQQQGFKLLYWTHNVQNKALNALYQRTRTYAFNDDNEWFKQWPYTLLKFEKDMLFRTGNMLQFVYTISIDEAFVWRPTSGHHILYYKHDGNIPNLDDIRKLSIPCRELRHGISTYRSFLSEIGVG